MDTLLIVVTAIALGMAIAMAGLVVKLLREERLRSAARVAALSAAVEESEESGPALPKRVSAEAGAQTPRAHVPSATVQRPVLPKRVSAEPDADKAQHAHVIFDPREPAWDLRDLELRPAESREAGSRPRHVAPSTSHAAREHVARGTSHVAPEHAAPGTSQVARDAALFSSAPAPSPWGARLAVAAGLAAVVGIGGYALLARPSSSGGEPPPLAQSAPLELLSLSHNQQPQSLTVTGLVQNPRGGAEMSRIVATAFVFAADNTFLGSGRAALDYSTLAPGDESPFVITIPVSVPVARYRVGFRDESGRVVAHVDRRANSTMAQIGR